MAVLVLAIAGIAIHASSGQALAASNAVTPGGSFTATSTATRFQRFELDVNFEWELVDARECEAELTGYAVPGRTNAADSPISFTGGSTWNCTAPADFDFSGGDWRLYIDEDGPYSWVTDAGFTLDVGGRTCTYTTAGTGSSVGGLFFGDSPAQFDFYGGLWNPRGGYILSVPFSAACGALSIRQIWGSGFSTSPAQYVHYNPYR